MMLIYKLRKYTITTQYLWEVWNRRRVVYYTILLFIIFRRIIRRINYIIVRFPEYDNSTLIVKTLDYKKNICFNLKPMSTLDIFTPLYKGSGQGFQ